jgi:NADPH:quinone reductase-like Zn-dependent oxidoreductase
VGRHKENENPMKAVRFHQLGGTEVLSYEEAEIPALGPGEALVQVNACAINHLDIWTRQGIPAYPLALPHISGSDVSGIVRAVSPGCEGISEGMPVIISPGVSCFKCLYCLSGHDNLCDAYEIFGAKSDGGYAEYTKTAATNLIPIPEGISFIEAAAFPLTFLTAWHMLVTQAKLQSGQSLLVLAAGSGVGSAAIQIGKYIGAYVMATTRTPRKMVLAKEIGADMVIDHEKQDFAKEVAAITQGKGADVVLEHVGQNTFDQSMRALSKKGTLVTCGATTGAAAHFDLRSLFMNEQSIIGSKMGTRAELLAITQLIAEKRLRPVIDSVYPLEKAKEAQEVMLHSGHFGKLILTP